MTWTGISQLGCWHCAESRGGDDGVAFTLFIPNALYMPGLSTQIAFWFLDRSRWVRDLKFPDLKDATMIEIMTQRLGNLDASYS